MQKALSSRYHPSIDIYERPMPVRLHNKLYKEAVTEFACESADNCVHHAHM